MDGKPLRREEIGRTANLSWRLDDSYRKYFSGVTLGDYVVATSGMTIGNNELFVREVVGGKIVEPYQFEFFDDPVTVKREVERARLNQLSARQLAKLGEAERNGAVRRNVRVIPRAEPLEIALPDARYLPYNKCCSEIVYCPPRWVVYWEDDGDAVLTFKKNGNWYLHGVGGKPFFKRPGFTWALVAPRVHARFLPEGCILDSGAPCAFPREGVPFEEVYFIMAWSLTNVFNEILKNVINHTRNIQGKDVERMPYPVWVTEEEKGAIVAHTRALVERAMGGTKFEHDSKDLRQLDGMFTWREAKTCPARAAYASVGLDVPQMSLF